MGLGGYQRTVYRATGLPDPDTVEPGTHHPIGTWEPHETPAAIDAVVARRLRRLRALQRMAQALPPDQRQPLEQAEFLPYGAYLETLRRLPDLRRLLERREDLARRQRHDHQHRPDKPQFYATLSPPTPQQEALVRGHDPDRFTADRPGYLAYLRAFAPPLAAFFFNRLPALISEEDRRMHTYITGSSGSGKSELMKVLVHSSLTLPTPPCLVILDPHGKFADEVAAQREVVAADRLVYINPALSPGLTPTLNPFDLDDPSAAGVVAAQLMGVFDELFRGANHAGLTGNMGALLIPCLTACLRMPGTDLLTVQRLFGCTPKDGLFQEALRHMTPQQRQFIAREWEKKRYETTKDAVVAKIQTLMNADAFLNFLCGPSTLDLDAAITGRKVICFSLQKGELPRETVSALGLFIMATLQGYVLRHYRHRQHAMVPIHVFVDECHNFLSPTVTEILEEARKFGLHLTLAQQYAGQKMDSDLSKTVLANTAVKIAGYNDEKATQREMARLMGLEETQLVSLEKRRFYVKAGDKATIKLIPPASLIDRKGCVTPDVWLATLKTQQERYYRPVAVDPFPVEATPDHRPTPPKPSLDFI